MGSPAEDYVQKVPDKNLYDCWGAHVYDGYLLMPDTTIRVMKWMQNEMAFEDGDVVLVAFPMSGMWWAQEVLWGLQNLDKLGKEKQEGVGVRIPFLEHLQYGREPADVIRDTKPPRVFKFHMSARYLAKHIQEGKVRVVVWLMNPREVMTKYHELYNWKASRYVNFPKVTWDQFFELLKKDQLYEGNWFENTKSYLEFEGKSNVLFMDYHEAGKDLKATVQKLADFCGYSVSPDQMKQLVNVMPYDPPTDWKARFSPEQLRHFDELYENEMKGTSLEKKWAGDLSE